MGGRHGHLDRPASLLGSPLLAEGVPPRSRCPKWVFRLPETGVHDRPKRAFRFERNRCSVSSETRTRWPAPRRRASPPAASSCTTGFAVQGPLGSDSLFSGPVSSKRLPCTGGSARLEACNRFSLFARSPGEEPYSTRYPRFARAEPEWVPTSPRAWPGRALAARRFAWGSWMRPNMPLQRPAALGGSRNLAGAGRFVGVGLNRQAVLCGRRSEQSCFARGRR